MPTPPSTAFAATLQRLRLLAPLLRLAARKYAISYHLLAALIAHESAADPWAIRPEPAFLTRYNQGIQQAIRRHYPTNHPQWTHTPLLLATSYGLGQVLAITALEHGILFQYPTQLCDPSINIDTTAKILQTHLKKTNNDTRAALLRYNGGADPDYPDAVLAWMKYLTEQTTPTD